MADALTAAGTAMFDDVMMAKKLPSALLQRFNECLITGAPTPEEDQKVIADAIFEWAREFGAIDFDECQPRSPKGAGEAVLPLNLQNSILEAEEATEPSVDKSPASMSSGAGAEVLAEGAVKEPDPTAVITSRGYTLVKQVGEGGFGTAHFCQRAGIKVVIKVARESLQQEQEVLASLSHPNVVEYDSNFQQDCLDFIVMAYCSGMDLGRAFRTARAMVHHHGTWRSNRDCRCGIRFALRPQSRGGPPRREVGQHHVFRLRTHTSGHPH